ncbi:hypothetical protein AAA627_11780 [Pseudomonas aeruginosa]
MPTPDPNRAWVDLDTQPDADLAAVEVDDKSWDRTRYFEVDPGTRELTVRYQFTVDPTNIGPVDSPLWRDCQLNLKFKDFSAGQRYRLEAGHIGFRPWAKLYDQDNRELARGREGRCAKV